MTRARRLFVVALLAAASPAHASDLPPRPGDGFVHDLSRILAPSQVADLEGRADGVLRAGADVVVLVRTRRADSDETGDDARRLLSEWRVESRPGREDGIAIVVNLPEGDPRRAEAAIRVGEALEGRLSSREVERIHGDVLRPAFREGRIAEGLASALDEVEGTLLHGPPPPTVPQLAAAEFATGPFLPAVLAAATAGVFLTVRLGRRRASGDPSARKRDPSLGAVPGGVLVRGRIADGAGLAGLLDLASRGVVALGTGPGGTILARPLGPDVPEPFGKALRAVVEENARATGTADLGTAPWAESRLGKAYPALRADLAARGLLDPHAGRRTARAAVGGGLLFAISGALAIPAGIGDVPGPLVVAMLGFGVAFALFARALTLPETSGAGETEGVLWRVVLERLSRPSGDGTPPVDLGSDLPFVLAAGRPDLVPRLAREAAASRLVPAWLLGGRGAGEADALALCEAIVGSEETAVPGILTGMGPSTSG